MNEYTAEQLENVRTHCEAEIAARKYWADNLTVEIQERLPLQASSFANDIFCVPADVQIKRLIAHFYRTSHGDSATPDSIRQWDAATAGQPFEGEFSFFQNSFPDNGKPHDFNIKIPGL
ncbi:hypothetical protein HFO56_23975 [Rhizobium laguerreae]|uniref:hypothetical protein n=1 Tax=Rhizobium laguerreae TaxID=1076926 RepID=UPI001C909625|nr:hypothetical protein [Rhizobium laguerreae]MBY3155387.1 hypothetical protein [Rhizobium laguerreae]